MTRRRLALAAVMVVGVYSVLAAGWLLVGAGWSRSVALAANVFLSSPGWGARASFSVGASGDGPTLEVTVTRDDLAEEASMALGMRARTYMPAAMVLSLVIGTPVPWRRRLFGAACAAALVGLFVMAQAWAAAVDAIARWPNNAMGFPAWGKEPFHFLYLHLCEVPTIAVLIPVLIWAVTTLPAVRLSREAEGSPNSRHERRDSAGRRGSERG